MRTSVPDWRWLGEVDALARALGFGREPFRVPRPEPLGAPQSFPGSEYAAGPAPEPLGGSRAALRPTLTVPASGITVGPESVGPLPKGSPSPQATASGTRARAG
jgi:hypothetical protein